MFNWVDVNIIDMGSIVLFVENGMRPITSLPDISFSSPDLCRTTFFYQRYFPTEKVFNFLPAQRIIYIVIR